MMPPPTFTLGFLPPPDDTAKYCLPLTAYVEGVAMLDVGIVVFPQELARQLVERADLVVVDSCGDEKDAAFRDDSPP